MVLLTGVMESPASMRALWPGIAAAGYGSSTSATVARSVAGTRGGVWRCASGVVPLSDKTGFRECQLEASEAFVDGDRRMDLTAFATASGGWSIGCD